jgi:hypothetical protein
MEEQKKCQCQSTAHGHRPGPVPIKLWMTVYAKSAMKRTAPPKRIRMERDTDNDAQT